MRQVLRFVRAHRAHWSALAILLITLITSLAGSKAIRFRVTDSLAVPWLLFVPVLSASLIGFSAASQMHDWEELSTRQLFKYRVTLLLSLLALATLVTDLAANEAGTYSGAAAIRNLVGFTGLALIGAVLLGASACWVVPLGYAAVSIVGGSSRSQVEAWAWPALTGTAAGATAQAVVVCVVGLAAAATMTERLNRATSN
jgi:Mn2+/Fe2+ NRAMP family transporter